MNPRKQELYDEGVEMAEAFLNRNRLRLPAWQIDPTLEHRGLYTPDLVRVNLSNCLLPVGTPGYSWSFPGYKADNTPVGVVAHETGHHVHYLMGMSGVPAGWYREPVSGYEPNWAEMVAETFKLMITNPDLLRQACPERWGTVTLAWGLKPVHDLEWRRVLEDRGAHPRITAAAENWVGRARR